MILWKKAETCHSTVGIAVDMNCSYVSFGSVVVHLSFSHKEGYGWTTVTKEDFAEILDDIGWDEVN